MTDATILLLAAGRSTRMQGADKLLQEVDGEPLLRVMARRATRAGPTRVVLGPEQTSRQALLDDLPVEVVYAPAAAGMGASLAAGVDGLTGPVLVVLADMPDITAQDLHLMLSLGAQAPNVILRAATHAGAPGHPVLFPADLLPDLAQIEGDQGARALLHREAKRVHLLPLQGDRARVDLDTPEDWAAWRKKEKGGP